MKIKLKDRNFAHCGFSTDVQISKNIEWDRSTPEKKDEIYFITDDYLSDDYSEYTNAIGWLIEPIGTNPHQYPYISDNYHKFKKVLTYDKNLLEKDNKFLFYPHGGCWIEEHEQFVYEKNKLVSMIASNKNFGAPGHQFRSEIREKLNTEQIDIFGRGINEINKKIEGLKDYMFSICVENCRQDYYFSEKIIDCFMTGTIPIYWGCPSIEKFFDIEGIITFESLEDLDKIMKTINSDLYILKKSSVIKNYEIAKKYTISEDWIFENIINNEKIFS